MDKNEEQEKMVRRQITKEIYIIAAIITGIIFLLGLFLGMIIDVALRG